MILKTFSLFFAEIGGVTKFECYLSIVGHVNSKKEGPENDCIFFLFNFDNCFIFFVIAVFFLLLIYFCQFQDKIRAERVQEQLARDSQLDQMEGHPSSLLTTPDRAR